MSESLSGRHLDALVAEMKDACCGRHHEPGGTPCLTKRGYDAIDSLRAEVKRLVSVLDFHYKECPGITKSLLLAVQRAEKAEAEVKEVREQRDTWFGVAQDTKAIATSSNAEVKRLREAAKEFLQQAEHGPGCVVRREVGPPCSCGRDGLVEAVRP